MDENNAAKYDVCEIYFWPPILNFKNISLKYYSFSHCYEGVDRMKFSEIYNINTGRAQLIPSHSLARFSFELSGNSN